MQAIVGLFIPPASREEVMGDLQERCISLNKPVMHYVRDSLRALPLVIDSRIRRSTDAQLLLISALVLYLSYFTAAWFTDRTALWEPWGLLRLAFPGAVTLLGLVLGDAYAKPGHRSPLRMVCGPVLGLA
jgi:hypothetical protein